MPINLLHMKMYPGYAALLAVGSILAASAEQPAVTVEPVQVEMTSEGAYGADGVQVVFQLSVPDGMCVMPLAQTWLCGVSGDEKLQYFLPLTVMGCEYLLDLNGCGKSAAVWFRADCGFEHGGIGRMSGVLPVLVMPELRKLPPVEMVLQVGKEVRCGDYVICVIGSSVQGEYSEVKLEISGPSPVAELAFSNVDQLSVTCFQKMPYGGPAVNADEGVKQVCTVRLLNADVARDTKRVNVALHLPQGNGTMVNVPIDVRMDMEGMASALNGTGADTRMSDVFQSLNEGEHNPVQVTMNFESTLPHGYRFASLLGVIPGSHAGVSDSSGKRIEKLSWNNLEISAIAIEAGAQCSIRAYDLPLSPDLAYEGEFFLPIATGKERRPFQAIEVREDSKVQDGEYVVEVERVRPSRFDEEKSVEVMVVVRGVKEAAGLQIRGQAGALLDASHCGGGWNPDDADLRLENRFSMEVPSGQETIDVAVEAWKDVRQHKVSVKGMVPLALPT